MPVKRPIGRNNLDKALHRLFKDDVDYFEMRSMMANVLVGQFLPDGVVKGGSSLKLRYGNRATRVTTDFDAAAKYDREVFIAALQKNLEPGWEGFTFQVVKEKPAQPKRVPSAYVMHPFSIKVSYLGKPWCTVNLELSHNEVGDADEPEWFESKDINDAFAALGFPAPGKVPVMTLKHQIAQKLHGASEPESERAHDLVDLQLIFRRATINLPEVKSICKRIFAYRKMQSWPPTVTANDGWNELYASARHDLPVLETATEAVDWANELVHKIDESEEA